MDIKILLCLDFKSFFAWISYPSLLGLVVNLRLVNLRLVNLSGKAWISKVFFAWISNPSLLGFQHPSLDFKSLLCMDFKSLLCMDFKILLCLDFNSFFAWILASFFGFQNISLLGYQKSYFFISSFLFMVCTNSYWKKHSAKRKLYLGHVTI